MTTINDKSKNRKKCSVMLWASVINSGCEGSQGGTGDASTAPRRLEIRTRISHWHCCPLDCDTHHSTPHSQHPLDAKTHWAQLHLPTHLLPHRPTELFIFEGFRAEGLSVDDACELLFEATFCIPCTSLTEFPSHCDVAHLSKEGWIVKLGGRTSEWKVPGISC